MKQYHTIIFDLDGTLLNTLADLAKAVNHVNRSFGFPVCTTEQVRLALGNGVGYLIEHCIPEGKKNAMYQQCILEFQDYYAAHMQEETEPFHGISELLRVLSDAGKKIAVVSNKFDLAVKELCRFYFPDTISAAIGESPAVARKPAPDTIFEAMQILHAQKETSVYIGDSEVDIRTAQNAGIPCISVTWGFREKEFLKSHGAVCFADTPEQLGTMLLD